MPEESKPRVVAYGGAEGYIKISGFSKDDLEKMLSSMQIGGCWVRIKDDKLEAVNSFKPAPDPVRDEEMFPFWRKPTEVGSVQLELIEMEMVDDHSYPSISIQSLCGYDYSPENYRMQAEKLESYGFECLRSRRGTDGKFYEVWYLSDLLFAKGELKEKIGACEGKKALKLAVSFLGQHVSFGTLDVSVQRLVMVID